VNYWLFGAESRRKKGPPIMRQRCTVRFFINLRLQFEIKEASQSGGMKQMSIAASYIIESLNVRFRPSSELVCASGSLSLMLFPWSLAVNVVFCV
jgi:hypothetical protein